MSFTRQDLEMVFKAVEIGEVVLERLAVFAGLDKAQIMHVMLDGGLPEPKEGGPDLEPAYDEALKKATEGR